MGQLDDFLDSKPVAGSGIGRIDSFLGPEPPTIAGEFGKGITAGVKGAQQAGYGLASMAGRAIGSDTVEQWGNEGVQRKEAELQQDPLAVGDLRDIGGVKDAALWAAGGLGQLVPFMATSAVSGGVGGAIGGAVGKGAAAAAARQAVGEVAKRSVIQKAAQTGVQRGAVAGAGASTIGTETGSIYADQITEGQTPDPGKALAYGIPAGLLDVLPQARIIGKVLGNGGPKISVVRDVLTQMGLEGSTEAAQTVLERMGANKLPFSEEGIWEAINAGAVGALGGGVIGGAGRAYQAVRGPGNTEPAPEQPGAAPSNGATVAPLQPAQESSSAPATVSPPPIQRDETGQSVHPEDVTAQVAAAQPDAGPLSKAAGIAATPVPDGPPTATEQARLNESLQGPMQDTLKQEQKALSELEAADARVQEQRQKESDAQRRAMLDTILENPEVKNPVGAYSAELKRAGFQGEFALPTKEELSVIKRRADVQAAIEAEQIAEATPDGTPNQMDVAALVPEKKAKGEPAPKSVAKLPDALIPAAEAARDLGKEGPSAFHAAVKKYTKDEGQRAALRAGFKAWVAANPGSTKTDQAAPTKAQGAPNTRLETQQTGIAQSAPAPAAQPGRTTPATAAASPSATTQAAPGAVESAGQPRSAKPADQSSPTPKSVIQAPIVAPKEPPIARYRREAADIEKRLPAVPEGHTRLWRGNRPNETGNPSFTNSLPGIALPFRDAYKGPLTYVDVPTADLKAYEQTGAVAAGSEFRVTPEIASKAITVEPAAPAPTPQPVNAVAETPAAKSTVSQFIPDLVKAKSGGASDAVIKQADKLRDRIKAIDGNKTEGTPGRKMTTMDAAFFIAEYRKADPSVKPIAKQIAEHAIAQFPGAKLSLLTRAEQKAQADAEKKAANVRRMQERRTKVNPPAPTPGKTGTGEPDVATLRAELEKVRTQFGRQTRFDAAGGNRVGLTPQAKILADRESALSRQIAEIERPAREAEAARAAAERTASINKRADAIDKQVAAAPVFQTRNGWEIVKGDNGNYYLRDPNTKERMYDNNKLTRVREVADEAKPDSPPTPTEAAKKPATKPVAAERKAADKQPDIAAGKAGPVVAKDDAPYTITDARYAKGQKLVRIPSTGDGFKTPAAYIAEEVGGRYVNRESGYIMSPMQAKRFEALVKAGDDAKKGLDNYFANSETAVQVVYSKGGDPIYWSTSKKDAEKWVERKSYGAGQDATIKRVTKAEWTGAKPVEPAPQKVIQDDGVVVRNADVYATMPQTIKDRLEKADYNGEKMILTMGTQREYGLYEQGERIEFDKGLRETVVQKSGDPVAIATRHGVQNIIAMTRMARDEIGATAAEREAAEKAEAATKAKNEQDRVEQMRLRDELRTRLEAVKFKKAKITLSVSTGKDGGKKTVEADAWTHGGVGVHRGIDPRYEATGDYGVTHINTGLSIMSNIKTLSEAKMYAARFAEAADFIALKDSADLKKPQYKNLIAIAVATRTAKDPLASPELSINQPPPKDAPEALGNAPVNTEDAGAELTYNRRNRIRGGIKWADIAEKNLTLQVKETTKQNVYPRPDYEAMIAGGMEPVVAHIVKQAYDSLAAKPQTRGTPTPEDLQRYIGAVQHYMDGVLAWANNKAQVRDWLVRLSGRARTMMQASSGQQVSLSTLAQQTEKSLMDVVYPNGWKESRADILMIGANKALRGLQPNTDEAVKAMKAIDEGWPATQEAWQKQGYNVTPKSAVHFTPFDNIDTRGKPYTAMQHAIKGRSGYQVFKGETAEEARAAANAYRESLGDFILSKKNGDIVGSYPTEEAAKEAARQQTKRDGKTTVSDKGISVELARREGPARRMEGENVTSDQLKETFGFKGVNFGNWMKGDANQAERQLHLNHAYDSFLDLAELLDVPPKAVSLNGMLGVAIGAQGSGGAHAAHFVPGVNEINLTRTSGAGSLAHEWGHALDHYFATQAGLAAKAEPFLTEHTKGLKAPDGIRQPIFGAFKSIVNAMNKTLESPAEVAARIEASRAQTAKRIDGWLAAIKRDFMAQQVDEAKFDALATRIKALDLGDGKIAVGNTAMSPAIDELRALYKEKTGRTYALDNIKGLQANVNHAVYAASGKAAEAAHEPQEVTTQYARNAASLDAEKGGKRYWSTNLEKFARAFDAYVSDKLEAKAAKNTYLSHAGRGGETVPTGTERTAINKAIDTLVNEVETRETDKGIALANVADRAQSPGSNLDANLYILAAQSPSVKPLLEHIVLHSKSPLNKVIARALIKSGINPEVRVGNKYQENPADLPSNVSADRLSAMYTPTEDGRGKIALFNISTAEHDILHEASHADLYAAVLKGGMAARQAQALYEHVKKFGTFDQDAYGLESIHEFLAEARSNPEFQAELRAIPAIHGMKVKNAWDWFVNIVRGILGLDKTAHNALSQTLEVASALSEEGRGINGGNALANRALGNAAGGRVRQAVTGMVAQAKGIFGAPPPTGTPAPGASFVNPDPSRLDNFIYTMQDKHIDTKRVQEAITAASGQIQDDIDVYLQETLFSGRAAKETKDFLDKELNPLFKEMAARKVAIPDFEKFLHARHAEERNIQIAKINPNLPDGGSGMDTADAKAYLAGLNMKQRADYNALAKIIDAINDGTRQALIDYGLESQATIDAWENAYQHYVPLQREDMEGGMGTGQGFSVKGQASKRATGSTRGVENIIGNIAMQRERAIVRGEKNVVSNALVGLAEANPNTDFWRVDQPPKIKYVDDRTGLVTEMVDPLYKSRENVVMARLPDANGNIIERSVIFNEHDERAARMAKALKNLDMDQLGELLGNVAKATRYFASVNTQYNPIFGVVNLTRDSQQAMFNLSTTPIAGKQLEVSKNILPALKGIYLDLRAMRQGNAPNSAWAQLFEEFQKEGGQTGFRDMFRNSQERADAIQRELNRVTEGKAKQFGRAIFDWLSDYNSAMENAVRLSAYKVAKDSGMTNQRAASLAKNLTVNFNRKGQIATQTGALYAFFNASAQGTARLLETLNGPMGRKIILGGITLGSLQALTLAAAGFDDDDPPDFVRERSLIIPVGGKRYITIPMPLGLHFIPNIGRISTEFALSGFKNPTKRVLQLGNVFADAFNPVGSAGLSLQTIAPTVVDPLAALAENKDWTGKPIAREDFNALAPTPGHTRAKDTASAFSKAISKALNYASGGTDYKPGLFSPTPDQLDFLIGQVTGGVGREVMKAEQTVSSAFTGEDLPTYKIPLVGRFYGNADQQASHGNAFYNNLKEINQHEAEVKGRRKAGEPIDAYLAEHPEARLWMMANQMERQVSQLRRRRRELMQQSADRETIKAIDTQISARMQAFNDRVKQVSASAR